VVEVVDVVLVVEVVDVVDDVDVVDVGGMVVVVVEVVVVVVVVGRVVVVEAQLPLTSVPDEHGHVFDGVLVPHDGEVPWQIHWYGALLHETSPTGSSVVVDDVVVVVVDGGLVPEIVDVTVFW
jgi:hypothetical protein